MLIRPPIERTPAGDFRVALGKRERAILRRLPIELDRALTEEARDPALRRLFPPAYAEDEEAEAEYRRLTGDGLLEGRRRSLRTFADTVDRDLLAAEDLEAWLTALNDLRLVLGTRLDVSEEDLVDPLDPRDPRAEELALYAYLSWLQEHVVAALSE